MRPHTRARDGLTLIEVILATALLTALAIALLATTRQPSDRVKEQAYQLRVEQLEVLCQQYLADHGQWPSADLSELEAARYLGESLPVSPVDQQPFVLNRSTGEIEVHRHP